MVYLWLWINIENHANNLLRSPAEAVIIGTSRVQSTACALHKETIRTIYEQSHGRRENA